jgi:hypothetical protein
MLEGRIPYRKHPASAEGVETSQSISAQHPQATNGGTSPRRAEPSEAFALPEHDPDPIGARRQRRRPRQERRPAFSGLPASC